MKRLFIPEITAEMFRNDCLESIEALMAEGEIYDIDYQQPCEDAVSRQAVIDALRDAENHAFNAFYKGLIKAHKIVANLPSVTPQPKTGRWIYGIDEDTGEKDLYAWTCSECEGKYPWQPKYCPNCGAKMESEDVEDKGEREDRATRKRG